MMQNVIESYQLFGNNSIMIIFFLIALLIIGIKEEQEAIKVFFVYPSVVILFVAMNPIVIHLLEKYSIISALRYVRVWWLFPFIFLTALLMARYTEKIQARKKRCFSIVLTIMILILSGECVFTEENFTPKENWYKLPEEVIEVTNTIIYDIESDGAKVEDTKIVVAEQLAPYIRQYNGEIKLLYGRTVSKKENIQKVYGILSEDIIDAKCLSESARDLGCKYLVFELDKTIEGNMSDFDYVTLAVIDGYIIYKDIVVKY